MVKIAFCQNINKKDIYAAVWGPGYFSTSDSMRQFLLSFLEAGSSGVKLPLMWR